jgi:hypothetical protein
MPSGLRPAPSASVGYLTIRPRAAARCSASPPPCRPAASTSSCSRHADGTTARASSRAGLNDAETWFPQLEHCHLPLYRALRAAGAPDLSFRLFMDEHAFETSSRPALAQALLARLRACEAGSPCSGNSPPVAPDGPR